jgi:hypothetical protein
MRRKLLFLLALQRSLCIHVNGPCHCECHLAIVREDLVLIFDIDTPCDSILQNNLPGSLWKNKKKQ